MVGVRHFGAYGEGSRLGVDLRVGEIHESLVRIHRAVGVGDGNIWVPVARGIGLADIYVALLRFEIFQRGHREVDLYGIGFYDRCQKRFSRRAHERTDVGVPL